MFKKLEGVNIDESNFQQNYVCNVRNTFSNKIFWEDNPPKFHLVLKSSLVLSPKENCKTYACTVLFSNKGAVLKSADKNLR